MTEMMDEAVPVMHFWNPGDTGQRSFGIKDLVLCWSRTWIDLEGGTDVAYREADVTCKNCLSYIKADKEATNAILDESEAKLLEWLEMLHVMGIKGIPRDFHNTVIGIQKFRKQYNNIKDVEDE